MSDALREAARRALEKLGGDGGGGEVTRLTVDVAIDGRSELVTLALRGGRAGVEQHLGRGAARERGAALAGLLGGGRAGRARGRGAGARARRAARHVAAGRARSGRGGARGARASSRRRSRTW
ncbi:MAG: hypothetical protein M5U28_41055 [Sandaracinaceae bacterium]|nr:hypothetical protein [Sandaracinaceae bacterium]